MVLGGEGERITRARYRGGSKGAEWQKETFLTHSVVVQFYILHRVWGIELFLSSLLQW